MKANSVTVTSFSMRCQNVICIAARDFFEAAFCFSEVGASGSTSDSFGFSPSSFAGRTLTLTFLESLKVPIQTLDRSLQHIAASYLVQVAGEGKVRYTGRPPARTKRLWLFMFCVFRCQQWWCRQTSNISLAIMVNL